MRRPIFAVLLATLWFAPLASFAQTAPTTPVEPADGDEQANFWAAFGAPRSKADTTDSERIWATLAAAPRITIGDPQADKIAYVFTDTDCTYCHVFWRNIRPWVDSGQVQLRYFMVDYLGAHSRAMAAAILMSASPARALTRYEQNLGDQVIIPAEDIPDAVAEQLDANMTLFQDTGFLVVPGILLRDEQGHVQRWPGVASTQQLEDLIGPLATP